VSIETPFKSSEMLKKGQALIVVGYIYLGSAAGGFYGLLIYTNLLCNTDS
jgi:hypothetical protein